MKGNEFEISNIVLVLVTVIVEAMLCISLLIFDVPELVIAVLLEPFVMLFIYSLYSSVMLFVCCKKEEL